MGFLKTGVLSGLSNMCVHHPPPPPAGFAFCDRIRMLKKIFFVFLNMKNVVNIVGFAIFCTRISRILLITGAAAGADGGAARHCGEERETESLCSRAAFSNIEMSGRYRYYALLGCGSEIIFCGSRSSSFSP